MNFSSITSLKGLLVSSLYLVSKFILKGNNLFYILARLYTKIRAHCNITIIGLSKSLSRELTLFNIRFLLIEPGGFQTNFLAVFLEPAAGLTDDYLKTPLSEVLNYFRSADGKQPGDPAKAARRIQEVIDRNGMGEGKEKFLRLPLGPDSLQRARAKMESLKINMDKMEEIALSTNFEEK
jgi:hypothetical protein